LYVDTWIEELITREGGPETPVVALADDLHDLEEPMCRAIGIKRVKVALMLGQGPQIRHRHRGAVPSED
jgi:hypothetical protein